MGTETVATNTCASCEHGREEHRFPDEGDRHDTDTSCELDMCICGKYVEKRVPFVPSRVSDGAKGGGPEHRVIPSTPTDLLPTFTDEQLREWAQDDSPVRNVWIRHLARALLAERKRFVEMKDGATAHTIVVITDFQQKLAAAEQRAVNWEQAHKKAYGDWLKAAEARDLAERQNDLLHKENAKLREALQSIRAWDMLDDTHDGLYFRGLIDATLAETPAGGKEQG